MNTELYGQLLTVGNVLVEAGKYDEMVDESRARVKRYRDDLEKALLDLDAKEKEINEGLKGAVFGLLLFFPVGLIMLIAGIVQKINFKKYKGSEEKRIEEMGQTEDAVLEEEAQKCRRIKSEKAEFLKSQASILSFLPSDYQNLHAVGFMLTAVKNCRADTLKEAINLYESELNRLAMMDELHRESKKREMQAENIAMVLQEVAQNQEDIEANLDAIRRQQQLEYYHK